MENKLKYTYFFISCLLFINVNAMVQDDISAQFNCQTGCIDLSITGGFPPYEVEWQKNDLGGAGYQTLPDWPKTDLTGLDGQEDLCKAETGGYKVILFDAACGVAELTTKVFACGCVDITLKDIHNASGMSGNGT